MHFKKILTIFLAAVLTFSSLTVSCVGAEEPEGLEVEVEAESTASAISSQPMIYNAGEEIKVTLRIGRNTGVTSVMLYIDYDETVLELIEYTAAGLLTEDDSLTAYSTSKGDAYLAFYSHNHPNVSCATGVLAEITFQAKAVCAADTSVQVSLFQNNEGLCTVWDENINTTKLVPFSSENAHFSVHSIDAGEGVVTAPTCQEGGYTTYVCRACKETVIGNLTGATGHTAGEAVEENRVEPTCTENGSYDSVVYCTVCESEISRETVTIGAVGHDLHDVIAKAPTCTEAGWNAYQVCRREGCGYSTYQELPASGHRFGEPTVYEPNYHQEGYSVPYHASSARMRNVTTLFLLWSCFRATSTATARLPRPIICYLSVRS